MSSCNKSINIIRIGRVISSWIMVDIEAMVVNRSIYRCVLSRIQEAPVVILYYGIVDEQ